MKGTLFKVRANSVLMLHPHCVYNINDGKELLNNDVLMFLNVCRFGAYWFLTRYGLLCWNVPGNIFESLEKINV